MWGDRKCEWVTPRDDPEWINDEYRDQKLAHMDCLTTESPKGNEDINILIITDHFTHYVQAIVTSSPTAKVTVQALWNQFIVHYSLSESILLDQGCNFESDLIHKLC